LKERLPLLAPFLLTDIPAEGQEPRDTTAVREGRVVQMEEIIVTSTRTGRRVQDEPLRVEVLDRRRSKMKILMTPGNVVMRLNETEGLRVRVTSASVGSANIRVQDPG
jgi:outer membrane receptor for ferrienterochelin and colicins